MRKLGTFAAVVLGLGLVFIVACALVGAHDLKQQDQARAIAEAASVRPSDLLTWMKRRNYSRAEIQAAIRADCTEANWNDYSRGQKQIAAEFGISMADANNLLDGVARDPANRPLCP